MRMKGFIMQRIKTRVVAILFAVTMAATVFIALPMTAYADVGDIYIGGPAYDSTTDHSTADWEWDSATNTLTLNSSYHEGSIEFTGATHATIYIKLTGDVTIDSLSGYPAISCTGGGGNYIFVTTFDHTLNVKANTADLDSVIDVNGTISFNAGTVNVTNENPHGYGIRAVVGTVADHTQLNVVGAVISDGVAIDASSSSVLITGSVEAGGVGVQAFDGSNVEVSNGIIIQHDDDDFNSIGVYAVTGSTVTVTSGGINLSNGTCYGIFAVDDGTEVFVAGEVNINTTAAGTGLYIWEGASVFVDGNVTVNSALNGAAVVAETGSKVDISGNAMSNTYGVFAASASNVNITGDVKAAYGSVDAYSESQIDIGGDVYATDAGATAVSAYDAFINILGNVKATGVDSTGVLVEWDGQVTVDGTITADTYISFGDIKINGVPYSPYTVTAADYDASTIKDGYLQYSITYLDDQGAEHTDYVWVKVIAAEVELPEDEVDISTVPATGDSMALEGGAAILMLLFAGAAALAWRRSASKHLL